MLDNKPNLFISVAVSCYDKENNSVEFNERKIKGQRLSLPVLVSDFTKETRANAIMALETLQLENCTQDLSYQGDNKMKALLLG